MMKNTGRHNSDITLTFHLSYYMTITEHNLGHHTSDYYKYTNTHM